MLHVNDVVKTIVTRIESYGVYFEYDSYQIVVLIPEISWKPVRNIRQMFRVGETVAVKIIDFIETKHLYKGSIRQLYSAENPYKHVAKNELLSGQVKGVYSDGVTVALSENVWGHIPSDEIHEHLHIGDKILVRVDTVEPIHCKLRLAFVKYLKE